MITAIIVTVTMVTMRITMNIAAVIVTAKFELGIPAVVEGSLFPMASVTDVTVS